MVALGGKSRKVPSRRALSEAGEGRRATRLDALDRKLAALEEDGHRGFTGDEELRMAKTFHR
jgi:hypothetical protein